MNRIEELEILIPVIEGKHTKAHDVFKGKHEHLMNKGRAFFSLLADVSPLDLLVNITEGSTVITVLGEDKERSDITIYHNRFRGDKGFKLSWYSSQAEESNSHVLQYLTVLGVVAKAFNDGKITPFLLECIDEYNENIEEQRNISNELQNARHELERLKNEEDINSILDAKGVVMNKHYDIWNSIVPNKYVEITKLEIISSTEKTIHVRFTDMYDEIFDKSRMKVSVARRLFLDLARANKESSNKVLEN
jgi:hypothetical protein